MKYEGDKKRFILSAIRLGLEEQKRRDEYIAQMPEDEREAFLKADRERLAAQRRGGNANTYVPDDDE